MFKSTVKSKNNVLQKRILSLTYAKKNDNNETK